MRSENEARLRKIRRISQIGRAICKVIMGLVVVGFVVVTIALVLGNGSSVGFFDTWFPVDGLTVLTRLVMGGLSALTFGIMFKCIYHLHRLLGDYSRGEIFTRESAGQLRQIGIACMLWGAMRIAWPIIVRSALNLPRPKVFKPEADLVVMGLLILLISWFMEMAAEMQEENELTV